MLNELPAEKAYRILESGPIVLVATRGAEGRANLMTMGFHMMMQHDPPLVGAIIGPWDHSHQALSDTGECVLAVPTVDLAETVVDIGNCSGDALDKFAHFGLTPASAQLWRHRWCASAGRTWNAASPMMAGHAATTCGCWRSNASGLMRHARKRG